MGQFLSQPMTEKNILVCEHQQVSHVVGEMQGYRLTMEDAYCDLIVEPTDVMPGYSVYGVFDGHGGSEASNYIGERLPVVMAQSLEEVLKEQQSGGDVLERVDFNKLIRSVFQKCDTELYGRDVRSGSTAVVLLLVEGYLIVANSGDSRCLLSCDKGAPKMLSFDHKPKNLGELLRIRNDGGYVVDNRVNGILALSRAFGDFSFKMLSTSRKRFNSIRGGGILDRKSFGSLNTTNHTATIHQQRASMRPTLTPPEEFQVTVEPEILYHRVNSKDEFIVLACDGVWDCYKTSKLVELIRNQLALGRKLDEIVELILENCLNMANTITGIGFDNMTIIIIALHQNYASLDDWYTHMKNKILDEKFGSM